MSRTCARGCFPLGGPGRTGRTAIVHRFQGQEKPPGIYGGFHSRLPSPGGPVRGHSRSELEGSESTAHALYQTPGPPTPTQQSQGGHCSRTLRLYLGTVAHPGLLQTAHLCQYDRLKPSCGIPDQKEKTQKPFNKKALKAACGEAIGCGGQPSRALWDASSEDDSRA